MFHNVGSFVVFGKLFITSKLIYKHRFLIIILFTQPVTSVLSPWSVCIPLRLPYGHLVIQAVGSSVCWHAKPLLCPTFLLPLSDISGSSKAYNKNN